MPLLMVTCRRAHWPCASRAGPRSAALPWPGCGFVFATAMSFRFALASSSALATGDTTAAEAVDDAAAEDENHEHSADDAGPTTIAATDGSGRDDDAPTRPRQPPAGVVAVSVEANVFTTRPLIIIIDSIFGETLYSLGRRGLLYAWGVEGWGALTYECHSYRRGYKGRGGWVRVAFAFRTLFRRHLIL
jgi:hypothetical protein